MKDFRVPSAKGPDRKQQILDVVDDCVSDLLYYDRKEDEDLPRGEIEKAIQAGEITAQDIADHFAKVLHAALIED
jgi:hypothetical protein